MYLGEVYERRCLLQTVTLRQLPECDSLQRRAANELDRQTDRQTPDIYIEPVQHTMWAVAIMKDSNGIKNTIKLLVENNLIRLK